MRFFLIWFYLFQQCIVAEAALQRRILAFWDSSIGSILEISPVHTNLEMPLNYLGFDVIYYDIQDPLPDISNRKDICAILLCFPDATKIANPEELLDWTIKQSDSGKKIILLQNPGFLTNIAGEYVSGDMQNRLYERLGFVSTLKWVDYPFDYKIAWQDDKMVSFELSYPDPLPGFYTSRVKGGGARSYLKVGIPDKPETVSDLIIVGPKGAYVSQLYANSLKWYLNPFYLFEQLFEIDNIPIPDVTTLAGRRIVYATCHGDGWNGETQIEEYKRKGTYSSEVILEKVIKTNPDFPIAVGIVAAEIDPRWVARKNSQEVAREFLKTPQVEGATHSYSHPFNWDFFKTGGPKKEINFLYIYPYGTWQSSYLSWFRAKFYQLYSPKVFATEKWKQRFVTPRAYANEPFNLDKEISGSVQYINQFAPSNKPVKLMIWPGDALPWSEPVVLCKEAHIKNYGGGFVRMDAQYPSILYIYPTARKPGGLIQLYASANSDVSYTNGWLDTFYGFKYLPETLKNTNSPRRLKPAHLNFHIYSGQFISSLNALLDNVAYLKKSSLIPLTVDRFCDIGEGFYSVEIEPISNYSWKILSRNGLQTMRFQYSKNVSVDLKNSLGVIGYREDQGCLYVYLDAEEKEPIITIKPGGQKQPNDALVPYLEESSWEIWGLKSIQDGLKFSARGWGKLVMSWKDVAPGTYSLSTLHSDEKIVKVESNHLFVEMELPYNQDVEITLKRI